MSTLTLVSCISLPTETWMLPATALSKSRYQHPSSRTMRFTANHEPAKALLQQHRIALSALSATIFAALCVQCQGDKEALLLGSHVIGRTAIVPTLSASSTAHSLGRGKTSSACQAVCNSPNKTESPAQGQTNNAQQPSAHTCSTSSTGQYSNTSQTAGHPASRCVPPVMHFC